MSGTYNGLYVTPTRLRRLRDVDAGNVYIEAGHAWHRREQVKLTAVTDAMVSATWIEICQDELPGRWRYRPTVLGDQILDAHKESSDG